MTARNLASRGGPGRRWPLWVAGITVLVSTGLALAHAAWNRSGEPRAVLELTERELHPDRVPSEDDTGLSLRLVWQTLSVDLSGDLPEELLVGLHRLTSMEPAWLDREALAGLGFDVSVPLDDRSAARHYRRLLARRVFVAYEMEGETWRRYLAAVRSTLEDCPEQAEEPQECLDPDEIEEWLWRLRRMESRLFAIDAAREAETLLDRYADRPRIAVLPAHVDVDVVYRRGSETGEEDLEPELRGSLRPPEVSSLHVPLPLKRELEPLLEKPGLWDENGRPRFRVRVAWGRAFEPWVMEVEPLPEGEPQDRELARARPADAAHPLRIPGGGRAE